MRFFLIRKSGTAKLVGRSCIYLVSRNGQVMRYQLISNVLPRMENYRHHDSGDALVAICPKKNFRAIILVGVERNPIQNR
jgi:hypothetical protein